MTGLVSEGLRHRVMLNVADALGERRDPFVPLCSKCLKTGKTLCHCFMPKTKKVPAINFRTVCNFQNPPAPPSFYLFIYLFFSSHIYFRK